MRISIIVGLPFTFHSAEISLLILSEAMPTSICRFLVFDRVEAISSEATSVVGTD